MSNLWWKFIFRYIWESFSIGGKSIVYYYFRNYEKEDTCIFETCNEVQVLFKQFLKIKM